MSDSLTALPDRRVCPWLCSLRGAVCVTLLATLASFPQRGASQEAPAAATSATPANSGKYRPFAEVTRGAEALDGLLRLYRVDDHVYARLGPEDWERPLLALASIAEGAASAGAAFPYGEQWVVAFRRAGDRAFFVRKNLRYEAPAGTPLEKAVRLNYVDSTLAALPIVSADAPDEGVLVDLSEIFLANFAQLPSKDFDRGRSRWRSVKAFADNVEFQVEATFGSHPLARSKDVAGDDGYVDERAVTLLLHYSLLRMPDEGFRPRAADPRLGHFVDVTKDYGAVDADALFVRRIKRWRLEKIDPSLPSSPPKQPIVWWIENIVPHQYVPHVEAGILEWNKAFARIGFESALEVRRQTEQDRFDPEDARYCTFRWTTTPYASAISNVRSNPLTGEILDGDILFDASWVRFWDQQQALARLPAHSAQQTPLGGVGEILSPLLAAETRLRSVRSENSMSDCACCQVGSAFRAQLPLAGAAAQLRHAAADAPELGRLVGQLVQNVVMHEVGHSLGLRHNFRGSAWRPFDQLHDVPLAREQGLAASVMDYAPINLALRGQVQGDYAPIALGPYDYWAIEYAYAEFADDEATALRNIAARSVQPELQYAGDEDVVSTHDPRVNWYDLGDDVLRFAAQRMDLADELLAALADEWVQEGEAWTRLRPALLAAWQQYGDAAVLVARHVGGRRASRDARQPEGRPPILPEPPERQRAALRLAVERLLCDAPVPVSPALLQRAATPLWTHWGWQSDDYEGKVGVPYYDYVYALHNLTLYELLGRGDRLRRIETNEALTPPGEEAFRLEELLRTVYEAVWQATLASGEQVDGLRPLPKTRRNLQRLHVNYLTQMVAGRDEAATAQPAYANVRQWAHPFPGEARSLARRQLKELAKELRVCCARGEAWDETSRAHLEELLDWIEAALRAGRTG